MKFGIALAKARWDRWPEIAQAAESLGYESLWVSEHMVFPTSMAGSPMHDSNHPPIPPTTPLFDTGGALCWLAGLTSTVRLGTFVYLLGIRHPFIAARAFATADVISGGRVEVGIGAGWLRSEWSAIGLDPATRGARLDESIEVCQRLWQEPTVAHSGEFWNFPEVAFEPKPVQSRMPVLVGGESKVALRRAARYGTGWIGMDADAQRAEQLVGELRAAEASIKPSAHRSHPLTITISNPHPSAEDLSRFEAIGVNRVIVSPWARGAEAADGLHRFAGEHLGKS
jgi:probable F420-dependent oxidoreductase